MPKKNNCHQESSLQIRNTDTHDEIYDANFYFMLCIGISALQLWKVQVKAMPHLRVFNKSITGPYCPVL